MFLKTVNHRVSPAVIDRAHPSQMPCKMALIQEVSQHELIKSRREKVQTFTQPHEATNEVGRDDHVTDAQARKKYFRECADVNHPIRPIHALQCAKRSAGVAVLAIVIVLKDPGLRATGPVQ